MRKFFRVIKKYLPDFLVIIGIAIIAYNTFTVTPAGIPFASPLPDYGKLFGVILITIGIDIAIRRYISHRKNDKNK